MLDGSTLYLLFAMAAFVFIAVAMVHMHSSNDQIRRKNGEVDNFCQRLNQKIDIVENDIIDLKLKIDEIDDEIDRCKNEAGQ